jgi:hypothetical protein
LKGFGQLARQFFTRIGALNFSTIFDRKSSWRFRQVNLASDQIGYKYQSLSNFEDENNQGFLLN